MTGLVVLGGPADAAHVRCGSVITQSTSLDSNVGPCPRNGIIVRGNNITLDLRGFRVFGRTPNLASENAGILLLNVTGVTVQNGIVEGFDAGVSIEGGGTNTVRGITARNNINDQSISDNPDDPNNCVYGDGITTYNSDHNRIEGNLATNNGPLSGISLVGDSDGNQVRGNRVLNNNVPNFDPSDPDSDSACGIPFARPYQDIGIRIEGPGANRNVVDANTVNGNMLDGIAVHGHVCRPPDPSIPPDAPNADNSIRGNSVRGNGFGDPFGPQDGIAILSQGPLGTITCTAQRTTIQGNNSSANARDGIFVGPMTSGNNVSGNTVDDNVRDGIRVRGPFTSGGQNFPGAVNNILYGNRGVRNGEHDGHDDNPNCDNNDWNGNLFGTVNQRCVARGGTGTVTPVPAAAATTAEASNGDTSGVSNRRTRG